MRRLLRTLGAVLWRMGVLCLTAGLLLGFLAGFPQRLMSDLVGWVGGLLNPYEPFAPDEFIYDYTLAADVPRVYYLSIPRLDLDAPVVAVQPQAQSVDGTTVSQLYVPNAFAVGWDSSSAPVGGRGNTVLVGHNNEYGEVFKGLWDLQVGDEVIVHTATGDRRYRVSETTMFQESGRSLAERQRNAAWVAPTADERLTMVTCWPYASNTHRAVVVALPAP